jgi:tripartite-type tricarboxylate transporter receptor subunit TctC
MGPANMPPAIVRKINADTNAALQRPEVREQFLLQGAEPAGGTAEEFLALVKREIREWADVVKKVGIQPQ